MLRISQQDSNSIILDSFAGSGTTAHAVLNMNKIDGGNRKFILVEMGNYADTITAERVKRVINGYGTEKNATDFSGTLHLAFLLVYNVPSIFHTQISIIYI